MRSHCSIQAWLAMQILDASSGVALILAPAGRDAIIAAELLRRAGISARVRR